METVKVSPKFQVVIPQSVRESMKIRAGERMHVIEYDNRIELIPVRHLKNLRGFAKGIDTSVPRDPDRV
jgi:AbrB family looped-hinge helix DNA binding protein